MNHLIRFLVLSPTRNHAHRARASANPRKVMAVWREREADKDTVVAVAEVDSSRDSAVGLLRDRICLSSFNRTSSARTATTRSATPGNRPPDQLRMLVHTGGRLTAQLSLTLTSHFPILCHDIPLHRGQEVAFVIWMHIPRSCFLLL